MANIWDIKPPAPTLPDPTAGEKPTIEQIAASTAEPLYISIPRLRFTGLGVKQIDLNEALRAHMEASAPIYNWVMTAVAIAAHPDNERLDTAIPIPEDFREDLGAAPGRVIHVHRVTAGHFKVMA